MENNNFEKEYNLISKYLNKEKIVSCNIITTSWCNNVFIINNKYTFKFPKINYDISIVKNESKLMSSIYKLFDVKIPIINTIEYGNEFFSVYNYIEGIEYKNLPINYINVAKNRIALDLSNFIVKLHSINIKNVDYLKKSNFSMDEAEINLYNRYNIVCSYLKNTKNLDDFKKSFDYIDNIKLSDKDFCLLHTDLNEGNFLINPKANKISGIIDFSNAKIGNYNEEFSRFLAFDYKLGITVIKYYQKITNNNIDLKYAINVQKMKYYAYMCNSLEMQKNIEADLFLYTKILPIQFFEEKLFS